MTVFTTRHPRLTWPARFGRLCLVLALVAGLLPASPAVARAVPAPALESTVLQAEMADTASDCPHHAQAAQMAANPATNAQAHQSPSHTPKSPMPGLLCCVAALPGTIAPALMLPVVLAHQSARPALRAPPGAFASFPPFRPPSH